MVENVGGATINVQTGSGDVRSKDVQTNIEFTLLTYWHDFKTTGSVRLIKHLSYQHI